ncbi:MAG: hypothetical protein JSS66_03305 [Armatimonadetes bacterium]|nr:hypothetical protein [Armatimonadota bacterium]
MLAVILSLAVQASVTDYRPDLEKFLGDLDAYGAFVRDDQVDLKALREHYAPKLAAVKDKRELLTVFEALVGELHDFHASLGTNNENSPRLVPSGTDIYAAWVGDRALVEQVKQGSVAELSGVLPGDEVVSIGGKPTAASCQEWYGIRPPDSRAREWALNSALAGRWSVKRRLTVLRGGGQRDFVLATATDPPTRGPLTVEVRAGSILYLRPENSLGDSALLAEFDKAVPRMSAATKIVMDLRNTPSGGNSAVARGIMGLFIARRAPFQRHRVEERDTGTVRDWVEYATPRLKRPVKAKLVVLVNRWTGSMGEGIAIGFDALKRGTVVGTRMAGLRGAIDRFDLPLAGFSVGFPTEQTFHVNGRPRHEWVPRKVIEPGLGDPWWDEAVKTLNGGG